MHIPYENKTSCIGYLEYILNSFPITKFEQISCYIFNLRQILSFQELSSCHDKLKQIYFLFSQLNLLEDNATYLIFSQTIEKKIQNLSLITPDNFGEFLIAQERRFYISEIIATEFKEFFENEHPKPEIPIPNTWFFERAEHFTLAMMHQNSPLLMESVFSILPEAYSHTDFKSIFENIIDSYVRFQNKTGLPWGCLFDCSSRTRTLLLRNLNGLESLASSSSCNFSEFLEINESQLEQLVEHLPKINKINNKLRCDLATCLNWGAHKINFIQAQLPIYQSLLTQGNAPIDELLALSDNQFVQVKKHLFIFNLFIKNKFTISSILLLSDDQLEFIYSYQRDYGLFFDRYANDSLKSQFSTEQICLIPQYYHAGLILELPLDEIFKLDIKKINLIHDNYPLFSMLRSQANQYLKEFLTLNDATLQKFINVRNVFFHLLKKDMSIENMTKYLDTHLVLMENNFHFVKAWTNNRLDNINLLLQMSVEDLEALFNQSSLVDSLLDDKKFSLFQIIAMNTQEREQTVSLLPIYAYLLTAIPGISYHHLIHLNKTVKRELFQYNYQYYKMLKSGFLIDDLCPLYRLFFYEMQDFCEHITTMSVLKTLDEKRFLIVMSNANAFKEYIAHGHVTFEQLTTCPIDLLEELSKYCYLYIQVLKISELTLEEFLKIDSLFRIKLAIHAGSFENILRNLKVYIHLTPELQKEIFEHRHAYGKLLLLPMVKLVQLLDLPDSIRHQMLYHSELFASIIPYIPMPFEAFFMAYKGDLVEFASFLAEHQQNLLVYMGFAFDDILSLTLNECRAIVEQTEFYVAITNDLNCSIPDFYFLNELIKSRILTHRHELLEIMQNYHLTFNDMLILDKRAGGQFFENVSTLTMCLEAGELDRETLLQMDETELNESVSSSVAKKPRLCCPSFI